MRVGSACCAVGDGAPTQTVAQALQSVVTRNNLNLMLPGTTPVVRSGNGYIQSFASADGSATYTLSQADSINTAYFMTGELRTAYQTLGSYAGVLGYPASDPLPGGAQKFTSGAALGGSPPRVLPALVASKWFSLGGATGIAGSPIADAHLFVSSTGFSGLSQLFANGAILAIASGPRTGQAFLSAGLVLSRYLALSGPEGVLGFPIADVILNAPVQSQAFENGYIDLQPGGAAAVEHLNPRHPAVSVSASSVIAGGHIHIGVSGFAPGAALSFAITGQPAFSVIAQFGSFGWDVVVPASAQPGAVTIKATAAGSSDSASASYVVTSLAASLPRLIILSGDQQRSLPGSTLPAPIVVRLQDSNGNPLQGVTATFSGSPGSSAQSPLITDLNGQIALNFRLPPTSGVAVGSLTAGGEVVTFSAIAVANTIQNFPVFTEWDSQGALTSSIAALLRYYQNQGMLPSPNGLATPQLLTGFLGAGPANPWLAPQFAVASFSLESPSLDRVRDLLAAGTPAGIILNVSVDGGLYYSDTVDAVGVAADGSILIDDPNPVLGRASLTDFLNGFAVQGHRVTGTVASVFRITAGSVSSAFTVSSPTAASVAVASPVGSCRFIDILSSATTDSQRFHYCDGTQTRFQLDFGAAGTAVISDFAGGAPNSVQASAAGSWSVTLHGGQETISAQPVTIGAVTDSAAYGTDVAPGELITIFGSGLGTNTAVTLGGQKLSVLASFPFQINAQLPATVAPGPAILQVAASSGTASKTISIVAAAPQVFSYGGQGAIVNQDGTINSQSYPARRGQFISVYCTGLGATTLRNGLQTVNLPVTVLIGNVTVTASFAGLVAGFPGLYQVNVTVPAAVPPGGTVNLVLQEGGRTSTPVTFALD